jgi:hypothetical protein
MIGDIAVIVCDNLLNDYKKVRDVLLRGPVGNWKYTEGTRNFIDYYDCRNFLAPTDVPNPYVDALYRLVFHVWKVNTKVTSTTSLESNWFLQIKPRESDYATPHSDMNPEQCEIGYAVITYLNTEDECTGGTAFFRSRSLNTMSVRNHIHDMYELIKKKPYLNENGQRFWASSRVMEEWECVGHIEMKPGRTIIFPADCFHAAFIPDDRYMDYPRLNVVTFLEEKIAKNDVLFCP